MDILSQKSRLLAVLGLILVVLSGAGGWVTAKILMRPGPRQEAMARMEAERKAMTEEQKHLEELKDKYEKMAEQMKSLPKFEPTENGIISPDQMRRFIDIRYATVSAIQEEQRKQPPGMRTVTQGLLLANRMMIVLNATTATKMLDNQMSQAEYDWIEKKVLEAEIVALLKLEAMTADTKIRETIHTYVLYVSVTAGYFYYDEKGVAIGQPEKVDNSKVPPQHLKYFLQYYKKLGMPQAWINELDWTPLLKAEGVTPL